MRQHKFFQKRKEKEKYYFVVSQDSYSREKVWHVSGIQEVNARRIINAEIIDSKNHACDEGFWLKSIETWITTEKDRVVLELQAMNEGLMSAVRG